jgi:hypothetical protein
MHKHECTSAGKVTQPSPGIPHGPDRSPALTTLQLRGQRVTCAALSHILDSAQIIIIERIWDQWVKKKFDQNGVR